jgi:hypothetical protein
LLRKTSSYRSSGEVTLTISKVRHLLLGLDALASDILREARLRGGDTVLHLHRRDVESVPVSKVTVSLYVPSSRARAAHVEHALDAVDLALDGDRDRVGDGLGIGTGVDRADLDRRRRKTSGYCSTASCVDGARRSAPSRSRRRPRRRAVDEEA